MLKHALVAALAAISINAVAEGTEPLDISPTQVQLGPNGIGFVIAGVAVNTSNKTLSGVSLSFNLYDDKDNLVGNAIANVSGLEPGGRWSFQALTNQPFAKYKVGKVLSY